MSTEGIKVVHAVPGRIRLKVAQVHENPTFANEVRARLEALSGIRQVEVHPLTSSVIVFYDAQEATSPDSLSTFAEPFAALFPGVDFKDLMAWQPPSTNGADAAPSLTGGISAFFSMFNTGVSQATGGSADLRVLVPLMLFILGARGLLASEKVVFPAWYDFFWFALGTFFMLNPRPGEKQ